MDLIDKQFQELQTRSQYANATLERLPNGTVWVRIPGFRLPAGWDRDTVTVYILLPVGYPMARPDCFWTDLDLRLASGAIPSNTGDNAAHGLPIKLLWFSWHPANWDPNGSTLLSYVGVIRNRLNEVR